MGAAVAEAEHASAGCTSSSALTSRLPGVAAEEVVDERVAVVGDGPVVEQLLGIAAERRRLRGEAGRGIGLVVGHRVPTGTPRSRCASIRSRRRGTPGGGRSATIAARTSGSAMRGGALGDRQVRERLVRGAAAERMRRAQPAEQALTVRADLRDDARAVGVLALDAVELVAPRAAARATERERDHEAGLARHRR